MSAPLVCPACWLVLPADVTRCEACDCDWASLLAEAPRLREALSASRWPLELTVQADRPEGLTTRAFAVPGRVAISADGNVDAEGTTQAVAEFDVDERGAILFRGRLSAASSSAEACGTTRLTVGGSRLTLRVRARPREVGPPPPVALAGVSVAFPRTKRLGVLGRNVTADVCVSDSSVGADHLLWVREGSNGVWVVDLGERDSGGQERTWVNDQPIVAACLEQDDVLQIGRVGLLLFDGSSVFRQPAPVQGRSLTICDLVLKQRAPRTARRRKNLIRITTAEPQWTIPAGCFVGIIGGSGVGKTTLLRTLAGLSSPAEGRIEFKGEQAAAALRNPGRIGYVPQDDIVHRTLTVRDALSYAARLRTNLDAGAITRRLDEILALVELSDRAEQRIDRLSGGQRKRVSIAVELLADPAVLFLDEPTSGLDPATEYKLMRRLRNLVRRGQTVILTTHSLTNIELLDRIIVLERAPAEPDCAAPVIGRLFDRSGDLFEHYGVRDLRGLYQRLEAPGG